LRFVGICLKWILLDLYILPVIRLNVILLTVALGLCGCAVHPPSAAAFMEQGDGDVQINATVSGVFGTTGKNKLVPYGSVKRASLRDEDEDYNNFEWKFQSAFDVQKQLKNFKFGVGLDWLSPYAQMGFVSDYFGVMGWSNFHLWRFEKVEYAAGWGGGITIIEQLPFYSRKLRVGLTQHLSRNGREAYKNKIGELSASPAPVFYDEVGGGVYVAGIAGKRLGMGLELRYGRDLTYKIMKGESEEPIDRFTLTVNAQWW